jgi:hypothetical protein
MRNNNKQTGATFISWLMGISILVFVGMTALKLVPVYIQYQTVKGLVDEFATNPGTLKANKRELRSALDKRLNVNMLDDQLSSKNFDIIKIKGANNRRKIHVKYDVQKPWFSNLDFIAKFEYSKEIGY